MASSSRVSVWWSTPVDPIRHFSVEQLDVSNRYFMPLRRAAALRFLAKATLMTAATLLAGYAGRSDFTDGIGFVGRLSIGTLLATTALRMPTIIVDVWFEYRHQFLTGDHVPVPKDAFAKVTVAYATILGLFLTVSGAGFYLVAERTEAWPLLAMIGVVVGAAAVAAGQVGLLRFGSAAEGEPVHPELAALKELAARFNLPDLAFRVIGHDEFLMRSGSGPQILGSADISGEGSDVEISAFSTGLGRNRRVVLSDALLREPAEVRDFVVGHELAHQAKHHMVFQLVTTTILSLVAVGVVGWVWRWTLPWNWLGIDSADPIGLPLIILVLLAVSGVLSPVKNWIARGHERIADEMAAAVLQPPSVTQSHRIHSSVAADLAPSRWARLYASHPAPPERLEFLSRLRR